jgi:hypothetical protein
MSSYQYSNNNHFGLLNKDLRTNPKTSLAIPSTPSHQNGSSNKSKTRDSLTAHSLKPPSSANRRYSHGDNMGSLLTPSFRGGGGLGSFRPESPSPTNQMSEFSFAVNSSGQKETVSINKVYKNQ